MDEEPSLGGNLGTVVRVGDAAFARLIADGHLARMVADRPALATHAGAWTTALSSP